MTEQEWLDSNDPTPMLELLRGKVSDRKFRLFLVGCCRRMFHLIPEPSTRKAVRTGERYADGEVSPEKLRYAWGSVRRSVGSDERRRFNADLRGVTARDFALYVAGLAVEESALLIWRYRPVHWALTRAAQYGLSDTLDAREPHLLRDIFGNPFRPVRFDPALTAWNDGAVGKLAHVIYEDRAFDRLPLLADALEDAGCDNQEVLSHCRSGGPHVRGCWVVDLLLGKQ